MSQTEHSTETTSPALSALVKTAERAGLRPEDIVVEPVRQTPGLYFLKVKGERRQRNRLEPVVDVGGTRLEVTGVRAENGSTILTYRATS